MNVVLVMFREDGEQRSFSLARDVTVVGRKEDADFRIPLSDVSRKHCRIIKEGNDLRVEDLGSSNGTFLNGERVKKATLAAGDSLQIGPMGFVVQIDGQPPDDELAARLAAAGTAGANSAEPENHPPGSQSPRHSDGGSADAPFDPMEALNADPDDSNVFINMEESAHGEDDIIIDLEADEEV